MPSAAGLARWAYDRAPAPLRRLSSAVPFGWRIGAHYRRTLAFLLRSERWSAEELKAYQEARLQILLERAIRNVPHYSRYAPLLGRPCWDILRDIEPVGKATVQRDPDRFIDRSVPSRATYRTSTGGTSGQPLDIVLERAGFQIEWAFMVAQWMRAGFKPGMRRATFRGVPFPGGRLWQGNPVYDELQFSPFAMNETNLVRYLEKLRDYRAEFLYGYPSALTQIAKFLEDHQDETLPPIKGMLCGSENIREGQREYLERVFGARLYSWYGMSEKVILAGECEGSHLYHAFPQYGVTEVIDAQGGLTSEPGTRGELVGTGFTNSAMPFIRYRLGDFASIVSDHCSTCGRNHLLLGDVHGRWVQEMVIGKTGAHISLTALNMHGTVFSRILRFQFHQREIGRATLRVVPAPSFQAPDAEALKRSLEDKTGEEIEWMIEQVTDIPLTLRGKGVFLVQELTIGT